MKISRIVLTAFLGGASMAAPLSSAARQPKDDICAKIAEFAASSEPGPSHAVILRGGWGGDTKDVLMTHECTHSGYAAGKKLCAYLLPNSSWEFGVHNAERAATCLDAHDRKTFLATLKAAQGKAEITSSLQLLGNKQQKITVRFEPEQGTSGISTLTIFASRTKGK